MGIKKFIDSVKEFLGLDSCINPIDKSTCEKSAKKKLIKKLLNNLKKEQKKVNKSLEKNRLTKKEKRELKEELRIISLLIKKGEKIIDK